MLSAWQEVATLVSADLSVKGAALAVVLAMIRLTMPLTRGINDDIMLPARG